MNDLVSILRCPETRQNLRLAEKPLIQEVNLRIEEGRCRNQSGGFVTEKIESGLLREDGAVLYPIRHQIPILLIEERIPLI